MENGAGAQQARRDFAMGVQRPRREDDARVGCHAFFIIRFCNLVPYNGTILNLRNK